MAIVTIATSITTPLGAEELHAHMWQAATLIADWGYIYQGGNQLQVQDLIVHLQPSKLLLVTSRLPKFHNPKVPTAKTLRAAWRIFAP